MKISGRFISLLFAFGLMPLATGGQEHRKASPNGYAIQITYQNNKSIFAPMYGADFKGRTSFTLAPWSIIKRAAKDSEQVSLVDIATEPDGSEWKITVSVKFGEFYDQGTKLIGTYRVPEGARVTIEAMTEYGVEPFAVSVVKVIAVASVQPEAVNKTDSLAVLNISATALPEPFHVELKNNSQQAVKALEINTYRGQTMLFLHWPQGTWERPLIEAGGIYHAQVTSAGRNQTVTSEYVPDQSLIIEISTVVFVDGSYEGRPYLAAVQRGETMGSKIQLTRVLRLLEAAIGNPEKEWGHILRQLKDDAASLSEEVSPASVDNLKRSFPTLNDAEKQNLTNFVKVGLHRVKIDLLTEISGFEKSASLPAISAVQAWLLKTEAKYKRWHAGI